MKILMTLFHGQSEADQLARTFPTSWNGDYEDGAIAATHCLTANQQQPPDIFLIKRPEDHTVIACIEDLLRCATTNGVKRIILLSNRELVRRRQFPTSIDQTTILEFDRETWTRKLGVWEWDMMFEHLVTHAVEDGQ